MTAGKSSLPNGNTYAFDLTDLDRETLAQTDEEFVPHTWEDLRNIIGVPQSFKERY